MNGPHTYELNISIYIRDNMGGNLNISETVLIEARNFLEMAKILGTFHELAEKLRTVPKKS